MELVAIERLPPPILTADSSMTHLSQVLRWKVENPAELKTFHLERSFGDASFVRKNWAQGNENFKKDTFLIEGMYKYRLIAVDTAGNESFSSPIYVKAFDLQPPMKPHLPLSNVDTMGHVLLRWMQQMKRISSATMFLLRIAKAGIL